MSLNVYAAVTPFVLLLILGEIAWCVWKKNGYYEFQDSIASLGTAIINQCVNVAVAVAWYPVLTWMSAHGLFHFEPTVLNAALLFLGVDFLFYWFHRFGHRTNIGWAAHMPHHSTEELNYAVALRASVTQRFFSFFFYWPMAMLGFQAEEVIAMVAFHLVLQLLPHTRVVPRLPAFISSWMNTPSHHRVHHARNDRYLDKNYGGFLIIWDKLFGSFEAETEACSYGVTSPPNTWDPTFINFQVWKQVALDAVRAPRFVDSLRIWFMPTGWRPAGLPELPKGRWQDPSGQELKFQSTMLAGAKPYLVAQVALAFPLMLLVTRHDTALTVVHQVALSALLWAAATAWGGLLESKRWAVGLEAGRLALTAGLLGQLALRGLMPSTWALAGSALLLASAAWVLALGARTSASAGEQVAAR